MALSGRDILKLIVDADAKGAVREFESVGKAAEKNLKGAETSIDRVSKGMQKWGAAAAITGGVVAGGLVKAVNSFEKTALAAGRFNDATGVGVEAASRWIAIADDIGVSAQSVQSAFQKMAVGLGQNKAVFANLGIEIAKTKSGATDLSATFLNVITRLQQIEDPTKRAAAAQQIFGRGYAEVAQLINTSSQTIKDSLASVPDAQVITPAELQRARDYQAAVDNLGDSFRDLVVTIGGSAAPVVSSIANTISGLIGAVQSLPAPIKDGAGRILAFGAAALTAGGSVVFLVGKVASLIDKASAVSGTLGSISPKLGAGIGGLVGPVGLAVTAFIALDEIGQEVTHTHERLKKVTDELAASIGKDGLAKAAAEFQNEAGTERGLVAGFIGSVKELGFEVTNLLGIQGKSGDEYDRQATSQKAANEAIKHGLPFFRAYIDGLKATGQNTADLETKYQVMVTASAKLSSAQQQVQADIEAAGAAADGSAGSFDRANDKISTVGYTSEFAAKLAERSFGTFEQRAAGMGAAIDRTNRSIEEQNTKLQTNINLVLTASGSALGVSAAQRELNKSITDTADLQKSGKASADDLAASYDRQTAAAEATAAATVKYAEDQAKLHHETLTAKESNDILIGSLYKSAGQMSGPSKQAVIDLILQLQALDQTDPESTATLNDQATEPVTTLKAKLDEIDRRAVSIGVNVNTTAARDNINRVIDGLNIINSVNGGSIRFGHIATGTDNWRGGLAMVGELGPELVYLPPGSMVKTAAETKAIMGSPQPMASPSAIVSGTSSGGGTTVIVNFNGLVTDERAAARELQRLLAQGQRSGFSTLAA